MAFGDGIDEGHADKDEVLHFYYNREERVKRAPKIVQDYYNGAGPRPVKGLFKVLVSTRANRLILAAMVACMVFVLFVGLLTGGDNKKAFGGIQAELSAFSFEESVYVSLKIKATSKHAPQSAAGEAIKATLWAVDADKQKSQTETLDGIYSGQECFLRTKFTDYDILKIEADVEIAGKKQVLTVSVQRR